MVRFSELKQRIIIMQQKSGFKNTLGESVTRWVPLYINPADAETFTGYIVTGEPFVQEMSDDEYKVAEKKYGIWAKVTPTSEREFVETRRDRSETTYNIKIRCIPGVEVTTAMKILFHKKVLEIESAINLYSRNTEIDLVCKEVDINGKQ